MRFIKHILRKAIAWVLENPSNIEATEYSNSSMLGSNKHYPVEEKQAFNVDGGTSFTIHNAAGGKVIVSRYYDRIKGENNTKLYVVHNDDDLAVELAHILAVETLTR